MLQSLLVNPQYWVHASVIIGESTVLGTYFSHYWLDGFSSGKHFHDCIISLRGDVWTHKINLTPSLFIEVPVSSEKSGRRYIYICFTDIQFVSDSTIFRLEFGIA